MKPAWIIFSFSKNHCRARCSNVNYKTSGQIINSTSLASCGVVIQWTVKLMGRKKPNSENRCIKELDEERINELEAANWDFQIKNAAQKETLIYEGMSTLRSQVREVKLREKCFFNVWIELATFSWQQIASNMNTMKW